MLLEQVLEHLAPAPGSTVVDGTLGAGGHSAAIAERIGQTGTLIGIDRDPAALAIARERLEPLPPTCHLVHGTYGDMPQHLADLGIERVDAILLDIGVSSIQLDTAERGFSFMADGPLDMRMDPTTGPTARDLCRETPADQLADLIYRYGEERFSRRIAAAIRDEVRGGGLHTTTELAELIKNCVPGKAQRHMRIHPATKTFQALRIAVNGELDQLETFLDAFPDLLNHGGRCAIISFHSLEDRMVKRRFRDLAKVSSLPRHLAEKAGERSDPICKVITRRPAVATDDEIAINPRARSAKLRVCEKVAP